MKKLMLLMLLLSCCFAQSVGDTISKSVADVKLVERTETCSPDTCRLTFEYCLKVPIATTDKYTWDYINENTKKNETLNSSMYLLEWKNVSKTRYISKIVPCPPNITNTTCYDIVPEKYYEMEQIETPFTVFAGCKNITWKGNNLPLGIHDVIPVINGTAFPEFTNITVIIPYYIEGTEYVWFKGEGNFYWYYINGTTSESNGSQVFSYYAKNTNNWSSYRMSGVGTCNAPVYDSTIDGFNFTIDGSATCLYIYDIPIGDEIIMYADINYYSGYAPANDAGGLIVKYIDADNFLHNHLFNSLHRLYKRVGASWSVLNDTAFTFTNTTWYSMSLKGNDTLQNGTVNRTVSGQTTESILGSGNKIAIYYSNGAGVDVFKMRRIRSNAYMPLTTVNYTCSSLEFGNWTLNNESHLAKFNCTFSENLSNKSYALPYSYFNNSNIIITNESVNMSIGSSPEISELSLLPPVAYYDEDLNCSFTVNDSDTPSVNITVDWLKNGVSSHSVSMPNMASNTKNWTILEYGNTSVGDNWACLVNATDGVYTASNLSANSTIINYTWPDVYLITPANNSEYYVASKTFAWICNDSETSALNAELYIGGILYASTTCTNNTICSELASTDIACGPGTWHVYCEDLSGRSNTSGTFNISFRPEFTYEFPTPSNNSVLSSKLPVTINISATCEPSAGYIEFNATNMTATCASDFCHYTNDSRSDGNYIVFGWMQSSNGTWYASAWLNYTSLYGAVIVDFNITKNYTTSEMMEYVDTFLLEDWWDEIFVILSFAFPFLLTRRISVMLLAGSAGLLFVFFFTMNFMYLVGAILVGLIGWIMKMFTG